MNHLVHVEEKEIIIDFELGRKCKTTVHLRNLMHTMPVAFKLQTTSPYKFLVRPSNGYIQPLAECTLEVILKPQQELPPAFPFSEEKFVLKTALAPSGDDDIALPERVRNEWFLSPKTQIFTNAKLKVVYIGTFLLQHCIASGDVFGVKQMLMRQTGASTAGEDGRTELHVAASIGNLKLVKILLQHGSEIDAVDTLGKTPLWEAVSGEHVEVLKELLVHGASSHLDESLKRGSIAAIHVAATLASTEVLVQLIEYKASLETKDKEGRTALHFAVEAERIESLKVLLRAGADKNAQRADGRTPLLIAAENGSLEMVNLLLESGASTHIKAQNGQVASEVAFDRGHLLIVEALEAGEELLRAARRGDVTAVATLLQHGGGKRAWAQDREGWTALHVAAFKGHVQIVHRLLLAGGTKVLEERDAEGHTPLHCAAEGGSIEVVELLLAMGANPLSASSRGATPAELASALGIMPIAKLLQHRVSNPTVECPSQGQLELNAKGMPRICSSITKPSLLHRRSISPGPDYASLCMPSTTPSPNHKELLSASSVILSTPRRLPQNNCHQQLHGKACSTPSPWLMHIDEVPQYTNPGSLVGRKPFAPSRPPSSYASEICKGSHVKAMLSPTSSSRSSRHTDAQKLVGNAAQSKHPSPQPMSSSATQQNPKRTLATLLDRVHGSKMELSSPSSKSTQSKTSSNFVDKTPSQVKDKQNLADGNQQIMRQNAASLFQRKKGIVKEVAIPTSDMLPPQNSAFDEFSPCEDVLNGNQHPMAASLLSKKTHRACKEAQTMPFQSPIPQQLLNGADLDDYQPDPLNISASLPKNQDQTLQKQKPSVHILGTPNPADSVLLNRSHKEQACPSTSLTSSNQMSSDQLLQRKCDEHVRHCISTALNPADSMLHDRSHAAQGCPSKSTSSSNQTSPDKLSAHSLGTPNPADSMLLNRSPKEQACPSTSLTSSNQTSSNMLLHSEHDMHVHNHFASPPDAPERDPTPVKREMMRDNGSQIVPPYQGTSPPRKTDQMVQMVETQSLKPTCKASWNDQNRPFYTPPLRIKQMRKPMSTPILRNSNSPRHMRSKSSDVVPKEQTKATETGVALEKPVKAKSVTFRDFFRQDTF